MILTKQSGHSLQTTFTIHTDQILSSDQGNDLFKENIKAQSCSRCSSYKKSDLSKEDQQSSELFTS